MAAMRRVWYDGRIVNARTRNMLALAEARLGYKLDIMQGSYSGGVSASAGTHDGGGAVDVRCGSDPHEIVKVLREVGFAAWYRRASQGPWTEHIHAIAIGDPELSWGARSQVQDYYNGRNGLASGGHDDGPRLNPIPTWPVQRPRVWLLVAVRQFTAKKPVPTKTVRRIQRMLNKRLGIDLLTDGVAGPVTREAFKRYQRKLDPSHVTGRPGPRILRRLVRGYYRVV